MKIESDNVMKPYFNLKFDVFPNNIFLVNGNIETMFYPLGESLCLVPNKYRDEEESCQNKDAVLNDPGKR